MKSFIQCFVALVASVSLLYGEVDEELLPGHSMHGVGFNEGPRQEAILLGGTGDVKFSITTKRDDREIQKFFNQGVGQLHGFWYLEAERSFRQVLALDPGNPMGYWGMAMANFEGPKERAMELAAKAKKALDEWDEISAKERAWVEGLAAYLEKEPEVKDAKVRKQRYVESLEKMVRDYPDDPEPLAFLVVRLWQLKKDLPLVSRMAVNALLDDVFEMAPNHPAHHYRIHLWDQKEPEVAVKSAEKLARTAPNIAHMWHMPAHIYSKLGRPADAAWHQEASARVDHRQMIRDRLLPDQIHNYAHNQEWLVRSLGASGRASDAVERAKDLVDLPRHPRYARSANYGAKRLLGTLVEFELWGELLKLAETPYLSPEDTNIERADHLIALGRAGFGTMDGERIEGVIEELGELIEKKEKGAEEKESKAREKMEGEKKSEEQIKKEVEKVGKTDRAWVKRMEKVQSELNGMVALLGEDFDRAMECFEKAELKPLAKSRYYFAMEEWEKAAEFGEEAVEKNGNKMLALANQLECLEKLERKKEVKRLFGELQEAAWSADLDLPALVRVERIANKLGISGDWRGNGKEYEDREWRPKLARLGPVRWEPLMAPEFELGGMKGEKVSTHDFGGQPTLLLFYLGASCSHCVQQLDAFASKVEEFEAAGIRVIGISAGDSRDLSRSADALDETGLPPFTLLADPTLETFRAYRAYDDFEGQPLHGTFLIDPSGRVRWQDIGHEPFLKADYLLTESKRLVKLHDFSLP